MHRSGVGPDWPTRVGILPRLWRRLSRWWRGRTGAHRPMIVRVLCGAYHPAQPFIEGGCCQEWLVDLDAASPLVRCPRCRQECPGTVVERVRVALEISVVYVQGFPHRALTFSRREQEPYYHPWDVPPRRFLPRRRPRETPGRPEEGDR